MNSDLPQNQPELLSRVAIANRLRRKPTSVINAIKRLSLKPVFSTGKFEYFHPDVIPVLEKHMRAKNYMQRIAETA